MKAGEEVLSSGLVETFSLEIAVEIMIDIPMAQYEL
jgi:hypothetical protein